MKKENGFIEIFALVIITTLILGIGIYMYNSSARNIGDATNKIQDIELYNDKNNVKY